MRQNKTFHKRKILLVFFCCLSFMVILMGRLIDLMIFQGEEYTKKADELHERERNIKAPRGKILDAKGVVLAENQSVCTISVIHNQITEPEKVKNMLIRELGISKEEAKKRVEKVSAIERVKTNVKKEVGDRIRDYQLDGVKVDEDCKRFYPYGNLASHVLGFTGGENQGILGLEVMYDKVLQGEDGKILTITDARGVELDGMGERRLEPIEGDTLQISLDYTMQSYVQQEAMRVKEQKEADAVSIILLNPQNGEIYACVNVPEFDLNHPFTLLNGEKGCQKKWNQMWRNPCISDTYEPGSIFKIVTASAGLEAGVVTMEDSFFCPGYRVVEDRRIHCAKRRGHGSETFLQAIEHSCNPVFIDVAMRMGVDTFDSYIQKFGLCEKTGIDLPGEAGCIMHKKENIGGVELATIAFGQSFQITPMQMATTAASILNGGKRITPHFAVAVKDSDGNLKKIYDYGKGKRILSEETSKEMRMALEKVVEEGGGKRAQVEGYRVGGKTATSQTLPRSARKYIASYLGVAPADDPKILGLCIIHHPKGMYYGGVVAAPVMQTIFENILPYLEIDKTVAR